MEIAGSNKQRILKYVVQEVARGAIAVDSCDHAETRWVSDEVRAIAPEIVVAHGAREGTACDQSVPASGKNVVLRARVPRLLGVNRGSTVGEGVVNDGQRRVPPSIICAEVDR